MNKRLQQKVYAYSFWIAISLTIILSIFLYVFGRDSSWKDQIYSVAASLIASVMFSLVFTFLANKEFINLIRNELNSESKSISLSLLEEVKRFKISYFPSSEYAPTTGFDAVFNSNISSDLDHSSFYLFRGVSAKYVPARVKCSKQTMSVLKIIIIDPQHEPCINIRATDRARNPKYQGSSQAELANSIRREIYSSVIALFDCRYICPVEIAYVGETSVVRLEIFDAALYLSLYHTDRASAVAFPETIRYAKGSLFYNLYRLDSFRQFEISDRKVRFSSVDVDGALIQHLKDIGMQNVDQQLLSLYRTEYDKFQETFIKGSGI